MTVWTVFVYYVSVCVTAAERSGRWMIIYYSNMDSKALSINLTPHPYTPPPLPPPPHTHTPTPDATNRRAYHSKQQLDLV